MTACLTKSSRHKHIEPVKQKHRTTHSIDFWAKRWIKFNHFQHVNFSVDYLWVLLTTVSSRVIFWLRRTAHSFFVSLLSPSTSSRERRSFATSCTKSLPPCDEATLTELACLMTNHLHNYLISSTDFNYFYLVHFNCIKCSNNSHMTFHMQAINILLFRHLQCLYPHNCQHKRDYCFFSRLL